MDKMFDFNTEEILEAWSVSDAIREIISNALDEKKITNTRDIVIQKVGNEWKVRDYGRGLKDIHFTQNESKEKLGREDLIGKFGFGLKDAISVLIRNGIKIKIKSSNISISEFSFGPKANFAHIKTLHAKIEKDNNKKIIGTEFSLIGVKDEDIEKSKSHFLIFNEEKVLNKNKWGEIIEKRKENENAKIYVNGICINYEPHFAFSYNIIKPPRRVLKCLNRERSNVGRGAYSEIIKKIIITDHCHELEENFEMQLENQSDKKVCDELEWKEVKKHIIKLMSQKNKYVFLSPEELINEKAMVDECKTKGYKVIPSSNEILKEVSNEKDYNREEILTLDQFKKNRTKDFVFEFINPRDFSIREKENYDLIPLLLKLLGGKPKKVKEILISKTMQESGSRFIVNGVWEPRRGRVIIHRKILGDKAKFLGTLAHEIIHAKTGFDDVTREFERALTREL